MQGWSWADIVPQNMRPLGSAETSLKRVSLSAGIATMTYSILPSLSIATTLLSHEEERRSVLLHGEYSDRSPVIEVPVLPGC